MVKEKHKSFGMDDKSRGRGEGVVGGEGGEDGERGGGINEYETNGWEKGGNYQRICDRRIVCTSIL